MYRLSTLDAGFLLAETHHSPKHVGGVQIFQLPKGKRPAWLRRMLEALKNVPPGFPFDHKLSDSLPGSLGFDKRYCVNKKIFDAERALCRDRLGRVHGHTQLGTAAMPRYMPV